MARALAKNDVIIADVGRWMDLLDAHPAKRAKNLQIVTEGLALADAADTSGCVEIAGSY